MSQFLLLLCETEPQLCNVLNYFLKQHFSCSNTLFSTSLPKVVGLI